MEGRVDIRPLRTKESMTFLSWINGHPIFPHQQSEGMPTDMAKAFLTKHFWVCSRVQRNKLLSYKASDLKYVNLEIFQILSFQRIFNHLL